MTGRHRRSARIRLALLAAVVLIAGCGADSRLDRAQAVLRDGDRFDTGQKAALAFARVASLLRADADACAGDHGDTDSRCLARFEASAYTQVTAVAVSRCTRPARDDARAAASRYLTAVARAAASEPRPPPPAAVTC